MAHNNHDCIPADYSGKDVRVDMSSSQLFNAQKKRTDGFIPILSGSPPVKCSFRFERYTRHWTRDIPMLAYLGSKVSIL